VDEKCCCYGNASQTSGDVVRQAPRLLSPKDAHAYLTRPEARDLLVGAIIDLLPTLMTRGQVMREFPWQGRCDNV